MTYDLHSHSIASDGTLTPTELLHQAEEAGVTHLALTDHDTMAGLAEAQQAAEDLDIRRAVKLLCFLDQKHRNAIDFLTTCTAGHPDTHFVVLGLVLQYLVQPPH